MDTVNVNTGGAGVCFLAGISIGMQRSHGKTLAILAAALQGVQQEAHTLNGSVGEIKGSLMSCQGVQQLMLAGRIKDKTTGSE